MEKLEKDFDDYVYDDEFYETNFEEENIENKEETDTGSFEEDSEESTISAILVCKDCANQWEDFIHEGDDDAGALFCPLCGSNSVSHEII